MLDRRPSRIRERSEPPGVASAHPRWGVTQLTDIGKTMDEHIACDIAPT